MRTPGAPPPSPPRAPPLLNATLGGGFAGGGLVGLGCGYHGAAFDNFSLAAA